MDSLFGEAAREARREAAPLAVRMRPISLEEFVGQEAVVGPDTWLRAAIESDTLSSLILYGPPGSGRTSLARVIAATTRASFVELSTKISTFVGR